MSNSSRPHKMRSKVTFYERELQRLRELLADNNIDFGALDKSQLGDYWDFYLTIYRKPNGYHFAKITRYQPKHNSAYLQRNDTNSYGWVVMYVLQCKIPSNLK